MLFSSPGIDQVPDLNLCMCVCVSVGAAEPVACLRFIQLILLWVGRGTSKASSHTDKASPVTSHITQLNSRRGEKGGMCAQREKN